MHRVLSANLLNDADITQLISPAAPSTAGTEPARDYEIRGGQTASQTAAAMPTNLRPDGDSELVAAFQPQRFLLPACVHCGPMVAATPCFLPARFALAHLMSSCLLVA